MLSSFSPFFVAKNTTVVSYLLDSSIARFKKCCLLCVCQGSNKKWKRIASPYIKESQEFIFSRNFPALVTCKTSKFVTKETSLLLWQTPWHLLKPPTNNFISRLGDSLTDVGYNFGQINSSSFNTSC